MAFQDDMNHEEWADIYKKLVFWELQMDQADNEDMGDVLDMQKSKPTPTLLSSSGVIMTAG